MTTREAILKAMDEGKAEEVVRLFREWEEEGGAGGDGEVSLVLAALYRRLPDLARELADAGGGPRDLLEAAALGDVQAMSELLEAGDGGIDVRSPDGFSPLHYAAYFRRAEAVSLLLERGADAEAVALNPTRVRPIHSAAAAGDAGIVRRLLEAGAEPDPQQEGGFTPLMSAALHGHMEMAELLLEAGADPGREADDGRSAAAMAREGGHEALAERLGRSSGSRDGEAHRG